MCHEADKDVFDGILLTGVIGSAIGGSTQAAMPVIARDRLIVFLFFSH